MTAQQMEERIKSAHPNWDVVIIDLTGTQDHWEVRVAAEDFQSLSRIKQHQAVMAIFDEELKSGDVHALSIKTLTK